MTHPVQAAQHFAREAFGDDRIDSFAPIAEEAAETGWRVRLAGAGTGTDADAARAGVIVVDLDEAQSEPLLSTCTATRFVRVRQYALRSISA